MRKENSILYSLGDSETERKNSIIDFTMIIFQPNHNYVNEFYYHDDVNLAINSLT